MTPRFELPSARALARARAIAERQLSREEVEAALRIPISETEREEVLELIRWFRRRYPTAEDRLPTRDGHIAAGTYRAVDFPRPVTGRPPSRRRKLRACPFFYRPVS